MNDNNKLFKIWVIFCLTLLGIGIIVEAYRKVVLNYNELNGVKTERIVK